MLLIHAYNGLLQLASIVSFFVNFRMYMVNVSFFLSDEKKNIFSMSFIKTLF